MDDVARWQNYGAGNAGFMPCDSDCVSSGLYLVVSGCVIVSAKVVVGNCEALLSGYLAWGPTPILAATLPPAQNTTNHNMLLVGYDRNRRFWILK